MAYNNNRGYNQQSVNTIIKTVFTDDCMLRISYWNDMISCRLSAATLDTQGGKHYRTDGLIFAVHSARALALANALEGLLTVRTSVEFTSGSSTKVTFIKGDDNVVTLTVAKPDATSGEVQELSFKFPTDTLSVDGSDIVLQSELLSFIKIIKDGPLGPMAAMHGMSMNKNKSDMRSQYAQRNNGYNNPNNYQDTSPVHQFTNPNDLIGGGDDESPLF